MTSSREWRNMHGCHQLGHTDLECACCPAPREPHDARRGVVVDITKMLGCL
uniref:Uncharacterized protein n=1 Tax=Zea mays TaxID=4577 RepID=B4FF14_MAIZE|nr:unknown [Zea mays]